jgi:hypothetical protein
VGLRIRSHQRMNSLRTRDDRCSLIIRGRELAFKGEDEYLCHPFARMDAPLLKSGQILFFDPAIFYVSQIAPFIISVAEKRSRFSTIHGYYFSMISSSSHFPPELDTCFGCLECSDSVWQIHSLSQSRQSPSSLLRPRA